MGRVFDELAVNGRDLYTLFDTGATSSYIRKVAAGGLPRTRVDQPLRVGLGGRERIIREVCFLNGRLRGRVVTLVARVVGSLGQDPESSRDIDLVFGALAMQEHFIRIDPRRHALNLSRYPRELIEY